MTEPKAESIKQQQIDRDLLRFYARNPGAVGVQALGDAPDVNPLDLGTVSWQQMSEAVAWPKAGEMDFQDELLPLLRKRLVWDIVPTTEEVKKYSPKMAVTPGSDEGDVIEEAASVARRRTLMPLMPLVRIAAWSAGEIISRAKMMASDETATGTDTLVLGSEHDVIGEVSQGTLAVIANLIDLELLTYGKALTGE